MRERERERERETKKVLLKLLVEKKRNEKFGARIRVVRWMKPRRPTTLPLPLLLLLLLGLAR